MDDWSEGEMTSAPPPARGAVRPSNEEMRQHIADMMIRGEWRGGTSCKALAAEWGGVAVRTVSDRALEASRAIRLSYKVEDWVARKMAELDGDAAQARELGKPRDAAYCIELQAKILGAMAPVKRQELPAEGYEKLSAQERIAAHKAAIAEEEAALRKETH